jgi:hypothetical protein
VNSQVHLTDALGIQFSFAVTGNLRVVWIFRDVPTGSFEPKILVNSVLRKAYIFFIHFMTDIPSPIAERENEASELLGIREVVSQVYKSVWEDFSVWEQDHCRQTLQSLSRPFRPHLNPFLISSGQSHSALKEARSTGDAPSTVVESFDGMENGSTSTILVTVHTIESQMLLQPLSYEACTPISRNLMIGDDSDYLPFIPNSDDPTYDYTYDVGEHKYFAWHKPNRDPDCAVFDLFWRHIF